MSKEPTFKKKIEQHKFLLHELNNLKTDYYVAEELFNIFSSEELNMFHLKAHEPLRDFSGGIVSGQNYEVYNLPKPLKLYYKNITDRFLKGLEEEIEKKEKEIELLENS